MNGSRAHIQTEENNSYILSNFFYIKCNVLHLNVFLHVKFYVLLYIKRNVLNL